jgi:hypothetical protein
MRTQRRSKLRKIAGSDKEDFQGNLFYLREYNLITSGASREVGDLKEIITAGITAQGLDFLEDDGGLGAILSKVTVNFDVENIRSLLEDKIISSHLPEWQKKTLLQKLRILSGDVLKSVLLKIIEGAFDHPDQLTKLIDLLT